MSLAITLHLLATVIWVGGMFFAYMALRPVAAQLLEVPMRLTLWAQVFERFFPYVWGSIIILLLTGLWITFSVLGGMGSAGMHVHTMLMLGIIMMLIFGHIYFAPFKRLKQAVEMADWAMGGAKLGQIRLLIGINLSLGLLVVVIATMGRYW
ncbi:MAG: CopD family protein [Methylicorpusculum sp.]|uniref:CopD family protein n=1 Tax=Methylicorpusculum sp. TaxID=2713644 RepID=UPI00271E3B32|nr:CopD family protein [Methylicorpusculum sp.]MDO8842928.1 CopD family protein [Methylicorpusculum sp.]MDO8938805.1 CopD family protein [Methylicorpusculum sp.]MDP2180000.1 CopD family protein [Methylicorpusculum sp.]MDP2202855.1 CopD family protein [Methylicorpusculum sp.]MDP3528638.1 CopD family protein [Methylicorpusculum sp.]